MPKSKAAARPRIARPLTPPDFIRGACGTGGGPASSARHAGQGFGTC
jgi:hypothetical protein